MTDGIESVPMDNETVSKFIRPTVENLNNEVLTIGGFELSLTVFIFGGIFILMTCFYVLFKLFGQPMAIASREGSLIQHFDTPKSAKFKDATITGGASRYSNIIDGTLAVATKSIFSINGKNAIITFAGHGVSIPIPQLAAMSILSQNNIKVEPYYDDVSCGYIYKLNKEIDKNLMVVEGFNFHNFNILNKQLKQEKYIPLVIESVENFITKNISAHYTEKKIKLRNMISSHTIRDTIDYELLVYVVAGFIMVLITYMLIWK